MHAPCDLRISGSIPTTLHPIFPRFSSSLDLQSRKKMKQESLGPLVISKPARLTTIACRSRAPWLTSASDPALCQKKSFNVSPVPMSLPWPGAILPKILHTNSPVWSFRPLPHPKKKSCKFSKSFNGCLNWFWLFFVQNLVKYLISLLIQNVFQNLWENTLAIFWNTTNPKSI